MSRLTDILTVVLIKPGNERYILMYEEAQTEVALRTLGRWASNPELSFSWYDAAVLSQRIRQNAEACEGT